MLLQLYPVKQCTNIIDIDFRPKYFSKNRVVAVHALCACMRIHEWRVHVCTYVLICVAVYVCVCVCVCVSVCVSVCVLVCVWYRYHFDYLY